MAYEGVSTSSSTLPIIIIGSGVAGLALGQGLKLHNIPFRIFERDAKDKPTQGHRFQLRDTTVLKSLLPTDLQTLFDKTCAHGHKYEARYVDAKEFDFPAPVLKKPGNFAPIDRTWIRQLCTLGLEDHIEYGRELEHYKSDEDSVAVYFRDGSSETGCLLVGADGIKSAVRKQLQPNRKLLNLQRMLVWGRTPKTPDLEQILPPEAMSWYMAIDHATNTQIIVEEMVWDGSVRALSDGQLPDFESYIYWLLMASPTGSRPTTTTEKRTFVLDTIKDWHPTVKKLFEHGSYEQAACVSVMSSRPDIEISSTDEDLVIMIGDAAHPMSPMGAFGGETAIWDATELVRSIVNEGVTAASMRHFRERVAQRAKEKIEDSFARGQQYWKGRDWTEYKEVDS